jgi:hypothetical protein
MRQNARQSISTDKPTTRACVKFGPLFLTHFGWLPHKNSQLTDVRGGRKTGPGNRNIVRVAGSKALGVIWFTSWTQGA